MSNSIRIHRHPYCCPATARRRGQTQGQVNPPEPALNQNSLGPEAVHSPCKFVVIVFVISVTALLFAGCETQSARPGVTAQDGIGEFEFYDEYQPVKAVFSPLTEIVAAEKEYLPEKITAIVFLRDSAGSQVKAPAVFRFELFKYIPRVSKPKGKRLHIWEDIDLNSFSENNRYWRDYLRAYEFNFEYDCAANTRYILELTAMTPEGRRLMSQIELPMP